MPLPERGWGMVGAHLVNHQTSSVVNTIPIRPATKADYLRMVGAHLVNHQTSSVVNTIPIRPATKADYLRMVGPVHCWWSRLV